jgi:GPH family glycoside/pentoside/hexuronide:cation symporter
MSTAPLPDRNESSSNHTTAPEDRLAMGSKVLYGVGGVTFQLGRDAMGQLVNPVFHILLGLNPLLIGAVMMFSRLWDAVTDPLMGTISDNSKMKMGRRRPYVILGAIASGATFPLIWLVGGNWSEGMLIAYFITTLLLFYTAFTIFSVPYESLGYELTPDYDERTRIFGVRLCVNQLATFVIPWLFAISQWDIFGEGLLGIRVVGGLVGVLLIICGILPGIFMVERYRKLAEGQGKRTMADAFLVPLKNGPFMIVAAIVLIFFIGSITMESLGLYVNIYYVSGGNIKVGSTLHGMFGTVAAASSFFGGLLVGYLGARFGKIRVLQAMIVLAMVASLLKWFLFNPDAPYLQLIIAALNGVATISFWALTFSMKADLCDYDEWKSGLRREGIYGAGAAYIHKLAVSVTYLITGGVLLWTGIDKDLVGPQTPETLHKLRIAFTFGPVVFFILALGLLKFYPITDAKAQSIRMDLEARRSRV